MKAYSIKDFNKQFPTDDACLEWLKNFLYPDGITCKSCGMVTSHSKIKNIPVYSCNHCGCHTHPMAGTIFERSRTPLKDWFYAIFLISHTRCGISAKQLQRELGVTYKTAFRMFHLIRKLLQSSPNQLSNKVEVDETYIGSRLRGHGRGKHLENKTTLFGMVERQGTVKAFKVTDLKKSTVMPLIRNNIANNTLIYTDEFQGHRDLWQDGYRHKYINHSEKCYVKGDIHTNTIEGFWSQLKRSINGVYHAVSPKYIQNYVDEYAFRYNHRKDEKPMFLTILQKI